MGIVASKHTSLIRDRKQAERERLIKHAEELLGRTTDHPEDQEILSCRPEHIVQNLKSGYPGWSVRRVVEVYIRSACAAHRKTNCITEVLFQEALARADELDNEFEATGIAEGAFWGLPSSFKGTYPTRQRLTIDTFNIIGVDSSLGCSPHCYQPTTSANDEGALVQLYRQAGGIPICKTNVPQTLLAFECRNPIWGATSNPYDPSRSPGGSSGGEAAILTLNGSPIGWGSDIGGSLRIPAAYSGCCGLKPVRGRWPVSGQRSSVRGFEGIKGMVGPLARCVDDLIFQSRSMINLAASAPASFNGEQLLSIPWREIILPRRLRIGWYTECGGVKTSPACARAVHETISALQKAGHDVVQFQPPNAVEQLKTFAGLTSADGYRQLLSNIGSDPMEPSMQLVTLGSKMPRWLHMFLCWMINTVAKDTVFASAFATSRPKSVGEYWEFTHRRDEYAKLFRKMAWNEKNLDAIICPVQAVPALEHGRTKFLSPLAVATMAFNVVDSTAGVLPVTRVDKHIDRLPENFLSDSSGSWILEKRVYGAVDPAYDAAKMHGLPVGVQVICPAWEEEKTLEVMRLTEKLMQYT